MCEMEARLKEAKGSAEWLLDELRRRFAAGEVSPEAFDDLQIEFNRLIDVISGDYPAPAPQTDWAAAFTAAGLPDGKEPF